MGLASALSTALTGLTAAETTIDVVGNNLANSNTVGFKASEASFATQFLQTRSLGAAPTDNTGGTNPRQTGLGTMVADITPNFNQGTIEISSSPTDLAIQGKGFFIVQGTSGENLFTRNGIFKMNSDNEMVTITGNRLLGYTVDENFEIQSTTLEPITIPLGAAAVAEATENVYMEGTLSPTGDIADTSEIIQTQVLGDAAWDAPDTAGAGTTGVQSAVPAGSTTPAPGAPAGGLNPAGTYTYRIVFANGPIGSDFDTESAPSVTTAPLTLAGATSIDLANIPTDPGGDYTTRRIYRTDASGAGDWMFVAEIPDNVTTAYNDTTADAALGAALDVTTATGNYSYYVTFATAPGGPGNGDESRPAPVLGPVNVANGRAQLRDLPIPAAPYDYIRIYRNLATDENSFHFVEEIDTPTISGGWTDRYVDADISGNPPINLDGPPINYNTLLTNLLRRDGANYLNVFELGTLEFTGRKGGRSLEMKEFEITATSTVQDLLTFMEDAMGIQRPPGPDASNPIPSDSVTGWPPGGRIDGSQITLVSNTGDPNAIDIGLSGMQLVTASGQENVNMPFSSSQTAVGEGAVADFIAYDTLGIPISVRITAALESRTSTTTVYRWYADSPDNDPTSGVEIAVGTGLITFDGEGNYVSSTEETVSIDRRSVASQSPLEFELDFTQISGLSTDDSWIAVSRQDGSAPGVLTSFIVGEDGGVRGVFSNGITRDLGQLILARFGNPAGLEQRGQNLYAAGVNSGLPVQGIPGSQGIGEIIAGATELSNTDIGSNLIDLILASTMYRGNTRVITTSQQMLDELLSIRR